MDMSQARVQVARRASNTSSDLSDPPTDIEEMFQSELRQKERLNKDAHAQAADMDMNMDEDAQDEKDTHRHHPNTHRKIWRVRDIENELRLTASQSDQLRFLINNKMKKANILGKMTFTSKTARSHHHQHEATIQQIIETVKRELRFLQDTGVEEKRLDELLRARAMINNSNEKHNEFMVKTGKVKRRADGPVPDASPRPLLPQPRATSPAANAEEHVKLLQSALTKNKEAARTPSAKLGRRPTHRPSVLVSSLNDLAIGLEEPDAFPQDEVHQDHQLIPPPTFNLAIFSPTAFLVRVINSTFGVAVHTSELIPTSRRGGCSMITAIDDMSFDMFVELVSGQVGFDVRGRVSAIMPRGGGSIVPAETKVRLLTEDNWKAVLLIVNNARVGTCEFVVESGDLEG